MGLDAYFQHEFKARAEFGYFRKNWTLHKIIVDVYARVSGEDMKQYYGNDIQLTKKMLREIKKEVKNANKELPPDSYWNYGEIRSVIDEAIRHAEDGEKVFYNASW